MSTFQESHQMENKMSQKMKDFIDKLDSICNEYGYEIWPTAEGWTGKVNENGEFNTIAVLGNGESVKLICIDGDGRCK